MIPLPADPIQLVWMVNEVEKLSDSEHHPTTSRPHPARLDGEPDGELADAAE